MRVALVQLNASDDPIANLPTTLEMIEGAFASGVDFAVTPEVTNCVSASREHQSKVLSSEPDDPTLQAVRELCRKHAKWCLIGSLALKPDDGIDDRFANRSLLIGPDGQITARYDKIHMFDVAVSKTETYRESAGYRPGDAAVLAHIGPTSLGLTICYDVRFPYLYRSLAQAGAQIICVPSAFSPVTGAAHWEALLRARAIETGAFILAPAQCGRHAARAGRERLTYGHSLAISPWGEVLWDAGETPGVSVVELDLSLVDDARRRVPSLTHDRDFEGP